MYSVIKVIYVTYLVTIAIVIKSFFVVENDFTRCSVRVLLSFFHTAYCFCSSWFRCFFSFQDLSFQLSLDIFVDEIGMDIHGTIQ